MSTDELRIVVAGGGRVGFRTAQLLDDYGHEVVLIEADDDRLERIGDRLPTVIEGNATHSETLERAAPRESDAIVALTEDGATNLAVCLAARDANDSIHTVLRSDTESGEEHAAFVDAVVSPERAGARLAANETVGGDIRSLEGVTGDLEILEIRVESDSSAAGERLEDVDLPDGSLVVADANADRLARPDTELEADQRYTIAVEPDVLDEVTDLLRG
jgi:trk system potassium uptake protein TrkA